MFSINIFTYSSFWNKVLSVARVDHRPLSKLYLWCFKIPVKNYNAQFNTKSHVFLWLTKKWNKWSLFIFIGKNTCSDQSTGGQLGKHLGDSSSGLEARQNKSSLLEAHFCWQESWWHIAGKEQTKFKFSSQLSVAVFFLRLIYQEAFKFYFLIIVLFGIIGAGCGVVQKFWIREF